MADENLQPLEGIKVIKIGNLEIRYEESEKAYFGTWKWGRGDVLVGSFTYVKKK